MNRTMDIVHEILVVALRRNTLLDTDSQNEFCSLDGRPKHSISLSWLVFGIFLYQGRVMVTKAI
jgi:hypothetical protein